MLGEDVFMTLWVTTDYVASKSKVVYELEIERFYKKMVMS
jgi:hypothetical protein